MLQSAKSMPAAEPEEQMAASDDSQDTQVTDAGAGAPGGDGKSTRFVAELVRAMQAAAEQNRDAVMAQFRSDSKTFLESVTERAGVEANELRRVADEDLAAIREWSKAEIARIKAESDERVAERRSDLNRQLEEHTSLVELQMQKLRARIQGFEDEMERFFAKVNSEQDPRALAATAQGMPEPPDLPTTDAEVRAEALRELARGPEPMATAAPDAAEETARVQAEPEVTVPDGSAPERPAADAQPVADDWPLASVAPPVADEQWTPQAEVQEPRIEAAPAQPEPPAPQSVAPATPAPMAPVEAEASLAPVQAPTDSGWAADAHQATAPQTITESEQPAAFEPVMPDISQAPEPSRYDAWSEPEPVEVPAATIDAAALEQFDKTWDEVSQSPWRDLPPPSPTRPSDAVLEALEAEEPSATWQAPASAEQATAAADSSWATWAQASPGVEQEAPPSSDQSSATTGEPQPDEGTWQPGTDSIDPRLVSLGLVPETGNGLHPAPADASPDAWAAPTENGWGAPEQTMPAADEAEPAEPSHDPAARLAGLVPSSEPANGRTPQGSVAAPEVRPAQADVTPTQVVVTGLVSVASIASFKRHLARVPGVQSVGVSSGPDGEFIFKATHDPSVALRDLIPALPGFGARVVSAADGALHVTAKDPEADA
jgi:hypothetical protein